MARRNRPADQGRQTLIDLVLDNELFSNNVSYAVEGNKHVVTRLKLTLNVNNEKMAGAAMESFATMAEVLIETALPDCKAEF